MTKFIRHGEVILMPVSDVPKLKSEKSKNYIVGHSETGHHHVLESKTEFEVMSSSEKDELFIRLFEPGKLVHKKTFDFHKTLDVSPGTYKVVKKTEYDPFQGVIREIYD